MPRRLVPRGASPSLPLPSPSAQAFVASALGVWWGYFITTWLDAPFAQTLYSILDNPTGSQPRFMLLRRATPAPAVGDPATLSIQGPETPVWARPVDEAGLAAFGETLMKVNRGDTLLSAYYGLQALSVLCIMLRINAAFSHNTKIGLASASILLSFKELADFALVSAFVLAVLAMLLSVLVGCASGSPRVAPGVSARVYPPNQHRPLQT